MKYVALLRGINVGGNKKVPMSDLKKAFEALGFSDVKTLLNSGNVVFSAKEIEPVLLTQQIEQTLAKTFGFPIPVIIRIKDEVRSFVDSNPFKSLVVTPETRLYITFLSEKPTSNLKIPYVSPEKNFTILEISHNEIFSAVLVSEQYNTTDAMKILEKEFGSPRDEAGKNVTTRNWNTVVKLAAL